MRAAAAMAVVAAAVGLAGCGGGQHAGGAEATRPQAVRELRSIAALRQAFNAQSGLPRLIVLVSPT